GAPEPGLGGGVTARQGAGVAGRGGGSPAGLARFEDDDRPGSSHPPGDLHEAPSVAEGFGEDADHAGRGVLAQVLEDVGFVDVGAVADGEEAGHAEAAAAGFGEE